VSIAEVGQVSDDCDEAMALFREGCCYEAYHQSGAVEQRDLRKTLSLVFVGDEGLVLIS
jgi:hypothetical protein